MSFLIAGPNFACGSSRESAAQWLRAFGIRCIIAPSFGGIFFDNCFRNGMLPLVLPIDQVETLAQEAEREGAFALDLEAGELRVPDGDVIPVTLPAFRRSILIHGADELGITLMQTAEIDRYQAAAKARHPWIWADPVTLPA